MGLLVLLFTGMSDTLLMLFTGVSEAAIMLSLAKAT